jgi:hypothetical protein
MSIIPNDPEFRTVVVVLVTLGVVAIFATADPLLRAAFALAIVTGSYLLFQRGKR